MGESVPHYPYAPGAKRGSPVTAFDAARFVRAKAASNREALLLYLECCGPYGATCDEGADACKLDPRYSSRPRLSELKNQGLIVASVRKRPGVSGRSQTVWILPRFASSVPQQLSLF